MLERAPHSTRHAPTVPPLRVLVALAATALAALPCASSPRGAATAPASSAALGLDAAASVAARSGGLQGGYDSEGRRDPFRPSPPATGPCAGDPGSPQAARIDELRLHGVVGSPGGDTALLFDRTSGRTHFVHAGERLCDGLVSRIDVEQQEVVLLQDRPQPGVGRPHRELALVLDASAKSP